MHLTVSQRIRILGYSGTPAAADAAHVEEAGDVVSIDDETAADELDEVGRPVVRPCMTWVIGARHCR